MIPWTLLDTAQTPGNGVLLSLYQHDTEFSIKVGNHVVMSSRAYGSEDALAKLACQKIAPHRQARVLIGGLGMGYTLRSALNGLGAEAQVIVAEQVPAVVQWNREVLADLAGSPLDDNRVTIHEADVTQMMRSGKGDYDAILLDVDDGPQAPNREDDDGLYSPRGLKAAFAALRPKGVLAIWSAGPEPSFARRLRRSGFSVDEVGVRSRGGGKGGGHHIVWIAVRF